MTQRYWHIEGYEGTTKIFDRRVKVGYFSEDRIKALLMALAAKAELTFDEILGSYAARNARIANDLLEVHRSFGPKPSYTCGSDRWFSAQVVEDDA